VACAETEFEKYRFVQDRLYRSDFDEIVNKLSATTDSKEATGGQHLPDCHEKIARKTEK